LRTSSPKASLPRPSPSFAPASTSPVASYGCGGSSVCGCAVYLFSFLPSLELRCAGSPDCGGCWSIGPLEAYVWYNIQPPLG
jgi:hypothetical protein